MSSAKPQTHAIPPELDAEMTPAVRAFMKSLLKRIEELEEKVGVTPQNSSLPPSTRHPHAKPAPRKPKSKRKQGGQPGHKKHERQLIPVDQCNDVQSLKPTECRRCGKKLSGSDAEPLRHQVWELPEIKPLVTEYQRHRLGCPSCGATTCAELPVGVPQGQSGPRLMAFAAMLMAYYRQSKRRTAEFLSALLGQPCCAALTVKMQTVATAALRGSYDELAADKFRGVVMCDRAKMYWRVGRLQWCWAHLVRDFQALIDRGDNQAKRLGYELRRQAWRLFEHWGNYRDGTISRFALVRRMAPVRREVERLLRRGVNSGNKSLVGMCEELHGHRDWLWMFVRCEGVEPTNNAGERALRHAVIWRKLSFGTQSSGGSRFVETMLTVIETCRQQGRPVFDYLTAAIHSHLANQPAPSLLPAV